MMGRLDSSYQLLHHSRSTYLLFSWCIRTTFRSRNVIDFCPHTDYTVVLIISHARLSGLCAILQSISPLIKSGVRWFPFIMIRLLRRTNAFALTIPSTISFVVLGSTRILLLARLRYRLVTHFWQVVSYPAHARMAINFIFIILLLLSWTLLIFPCYPLTF